MKNMIYSNGILFDYGSASKPNGCRLFVNYLSMADNIAKLSASGAEPFPGGPETEEGARAAPSSSGMCGCVTWTIPRARR